MKREVSKLRNFKYVKVVFILFFTICACDNVGTVEFEYYENYMQDRLSSEALRETKVIYIIPNGGCDGCITTAESFVLENAKEYQESLLIIFTGFTSLKSLKLKLSPIIDNPNVILDQEDFFYRGKLMSIYPTIILNKALIMLKL
jgi:hypothetical protein